jgi:hypothetical protein
MEENKKAAIEKIYQLTKQDAEFNAELRKKLTSSADSTTVDDERLNQIYEYCIEKIILEQAENFYKDFPIKDIIGQLKTDFSRMESFRRKNQFEDYALALYQQIECMVNFVFSQESFVKTINSLWSNPSYSPQKGGKRTIANEIFGSGDYLTSGLERAKNNHYSAKDKIRCVVYFIGGFWNSNSYPANFVKLSEILSDIYICRNTNHRGAAQNPIVDEKIKTFHESFTCSYFLFNAALVEFVRIIQDGFSKFVITTCLGTIFEIISGACFIKREEMEQNELLPEMLLTKAKNLSKGDRVEITLLANQIIDINKI